MERVVSLGAYGVRGIMNRNQEYIDLAKKSACL